MGKYKDYILLHGLVYLSSLIPSALKYIPIPPVETVFLRTLMAVVILGGYVLVKRLKIALEKQEMMVLLFSGVLTSIYWILLVLAVKLSNSSVALVGSATTPLWVTFISPLFTGKKIDFYQFMTGLNAMFGVYMIISSDFEYQWGLLVAILAAVFGALLTVINANLAKKHSHITVTFYQMSGAWTGTVLFLPIYAKYFSEGNKIDFDAGTVGFILIFLLALVFSVMAYSILIKIMKRIAPFTVALASNLSPVYGIMAALVIWGNDELMTIYFYSGTIIIIASVMANPLVSHFFRDSIPAKGEVKASSSS